MVVAEGEVGEDLRHLLAGVRRDPRCHRLNLALHVGDAGLEDVAVELGGGDVMAFADHEIRDLVLGGRGRRADHDMREQRAEDDVGLVLPGELADHLGAARRIGAVILDHQFDLAAADASGIVDRLDGGGARLLVPAAVGGADARAVRLEADLDRRRALRLAVADEAGRERKAGAGGDALQRSAARKRGFREVEKSVLVSHVRSPVFAVLTSDKAARSSLVGGCENCMCTN